MSQQIIQSKSDNSTDIIQKLPNQWTLWFSYSSDTQNDINYGSNLMKIQKLIYWNDFALIWSWVNKTQKFFMNTDDGTYNKYKFGTQERKIDSINFFKYDIQPQWEYGDNPKYGYFNFGIDRNQNKINQIFQATVFLALGGTQQIAENIVGIRIVDLGVKPNHPSRARIQIWVDFRHDNSKQSIQKLSYFQGIFQKYYYGKIQYQINQIKFFNISNQDNNEVKTPNKNNSQNYKSQGNRNNNKKFKKN